MTEAVAKVIPLYVQILHKTRPVLVHPALRAEGLREETAP